VELTFIFNRYHTPSPGNYRVVGVLVWPSRYLIHILKVLWLMLTWTNSVGGSQDATPYCESDRGPWLLSESQKNRVRYTYRVTWNVSPNPFSHLSVNTNLVHV
jgi:transmembrane 9 superfamily member 2/4